MLHQLEDFVHTEVDRGRDTEESIDIDVDRDAGIEADTGIDIAAVDNDSFQTDRAGAWPEYVEGAWADCWLENEEGDGAGA